MNAKKPVRRQNNLRRVLTGAVIALTIAVCFILALLFLIASVGSLYLALTSSDDGPFKNAFVAVVQFLIAFAFGAAMLIAKSFFSDVIRKPAENAANPVDSDRDEPLPEA